MHVLLATDSSADDRKTFAAAESLLRAGFRVTLGGDKLSRPVFQLSASMGHLHYPHPISNPSAFIRQVVEAVSTRSIDLVLPFSDGTTIAITDSQKQIQFRTLVAPRESFRLASDKLRLLRYAERIGISIPRTYAPESLDDYRAVADQIQFPCVAKWRRSSAGIGLQFPRTPEQLIHLAKADKLKSDSAFDQRHLVQEFIPGEIRDVACLFRNGKPLATLVSRRITMQPSTGGPGLVVETVSDPALARLGEKLLSSLDWHGPAQVEFRVDERNGEPYLMEINARFWGTLALAIEAGIDFPVMACRMALGEEVEIGQEYRSGIRRRLPFLEGP